MRSTFTALPRNMGGSALNHTPTRRYSREEYFALYRNVVLPVLETTFCDVRSVLIPAYHTKDSFGDMDILISTPNPITPSLNARIRSTFHPSETVINGPVVSFAIGDFQVDFITVPSDIFDFALGYLSYNDLGNLLGRVFANVGLKFGHQGVFLKETSQNGQAIETRLTATFEEALEIAGYNPDVFSRGFETLDDVFEYVISSPLFPNPMYLSPKFRRDKARRDSVEKFAMFLESRSIPLVADTPQLRQLEHTLEYLSAVLPDHAFTALTAARMDTHSKFATRVRFKRVFDARRIETVLGIRGKELGQLFQYIRETVPECEWHGFEGATDDEWAALLTALAQRCFSWRGT